MIPAYPLTWPDGWKRIPANGRVRARIDAEPGKIIVEGVK